MKNVVKSSKCTETEIGKKTWVVFCQSEIHELSYLGGQLHCNHVRHSKLAGSRPIHARRSTHNTHQPSPSFYHQIRKEKKTSSENIFGLKHSSYWIWHCFFAPFSLASFLNKVNAHAWWLKVTWIEESITMSVSVRNRTSREIFHKVTEYRRVLDILVSQYKTRHLPNPGLSQWVENRTKTQFLFTLPSLLFSRSANSHANTLSLPLSLSSPPPSLSLSLTQCVLLILNGKGFNLHKL